MTVEIAAPAVRDARYVGDLDTPVAVVDVAKLERNLTAMAELIRPTGIVHRPHAKTHKTREIAQRQRAHGAIGLTVAKLGEAEAFADEGFDDLFVAYPIVGEQKLERLVALSERARIRFEIDTYEAARAASGFLAARGRRIDVVVSLDGGAGRSAVPTVADAIALGERVAELPGLNLIGAMNYGNAYGTTDAAEQRTIGRREGDDAVAIAAALRDRGIGANLVTVGSTPTTRYVIEVPGVTEVRSGVYAFLDLKQVSLGSGTMEDCALTILATVVSHARPDRYVLDAGLKTLAGEDYGWGTWGRPLERPDLAIIRATEEHGVIELLAGAADPRWKIGDRVRIVPNHACGVANMHDELVAVDGERVIDRWRVIARGRVR